MYDNSMVPYRYHNFGRPITMLVLDVGSVTIMVMRIRITYNTTIGRGQARTADGCPASAYADTTGDRWENYNYGNAG